MHCCFAVNFKTNCKINKINLSLTNLVALETLKLIGC